MYMQKPVQEDKMAKPTKWKMKNHHTIPWHTESKANQKCFDICFWPQFRFISLQFVTSVDAVKD